MKKSVTPLLWMLVLLNVVLTLLNAVFPNHIPVPLRIVVSIVVPLAFALLHGTQRYKWSGIITFLVMCLVVSNLPGKSCFTLISTRPTGTKPGMGSDGK